MVAAECRAREGERSTVLRVDAPASGLVAGLRLGILDQQSRRLDGGPYSNCEEADLVVVAEGRAGEGERGTLLHADAPASGLVARLRLRILDEKSRGSDGGGGARRQEPYIMVVAEGDPREGERSTL